MGWMEGWGWARLRALLSVVLTFGAPGALAVAAVSRCHRLAPRGATFFAPLAAGCAASLAFLAWSVVSAHTDGRFLWTGYPFAIPLGLAWIETGFSPSPEHSNEKAGRS